MAIKKIMTDLEFKEKLIKLTEMKTCYLYGGLMHKITNEIIETKAKQLPQWYTPTRIANLKALVGKGYVGSDCVNTIKCVIWGLFTDDGIKYASNGLPDTNANGLIRLCEDVSTNMKDIEPMEVIWFNSHVGIYLGKIDGIDYCIECAPSTNKIAITKLSYQGKWAKHGKLPWIDYGSIKEEQEDVKEDTKQESQWDEIQWIKDVQKAIGTTVDGIIGKNSLAALPTVSKTVNRKHEVVKLIQEKLNYLGYAVGDIDGIAGTKFDLCIKKYQKDVVGLKKPDGKLTASGRVGATWKKLLGVN